MANQSFIHEATFHFLGKDHGWELIRSVTILQSPIQDIGEDEATINKLLEENLLDKVNVPEGTFVRILAAGQIIYNMLHSPEGVDISVEVIPAWSSISIMSDVERKIIEIEENISD